MTDNLGQGSTIDKFHCNINSAFGFANLMDMADISMRKLGHNGCLAFKALKLVRRCALASFAMVAAAAFLSFGSFVHSARFASVILAGGAGALYVSQSSFWAVTADIAGASSGSVSGFMNMGAQAGGALTASLTPWIAARLGWTASFLVAAALCLVGAVSWLAVDPTKPLALRPALRSSTSVADHSASRIGITPANS